MMQKEKVQPIPRVSIKQKDGVLVFEEKNCFDDTFYSISELTKEALLRYPVEKDFSYLVNTYDYQAGNDWIDFAMCTHLGQYDRCYPTYVFQGWQACGIDDYERVVKSLEDTKPAKKGVIGWIGNLTTSAWRRSFHETYHGKTPLLEMFANDWAFRHDPTQPKVYMTIKEQIDRWEYMLDIEGNGFSGRLPLLLRSPRIVFMLERPWHEWWFPYLEPWKHFVPVKRDGSDIAESYEKLVSTPGLQDYIKENQKAFADKYLTREMAYKRVHEVLMRGSPLEPKP